MSSNLSKMAESENTYSFYLPESQSILGMEGNGGSTNHTPATAALQAIPSWPTLVQQQAAR